MEYINDPIQISNIKNIFNEITEDYYINPELQELYDTIMGIKIISIDYAVHNFGDEIFLVVDRKHLDDALFKIDKYMYKIYNNYKQSRHYPYHFFDDTQSLIVIRYTELTPSFKECIFKDNKINNFEI